jgi:predicted RNase H-like HicB family nuclease
LSFINAPDIIFHMIYTVIVEKGRESGYIAYAPALRGCVSQGETREKVLKNIKEAMEVYVEALLEDGLPVPTEIGKDMVELEVAAK